MTDPHTTYNARIDGPHGDDYARRVGAFQESILRQRITSDIDEAFERAVRKVELVWGALQAARGC